MAASKNATRSVTRRSPPPVMLSSVTRRSPPPVMPSPRRRRSWKNCGGYDCEFVSPPPEAIQVECPKCLLIPKEPCVISCMCGKEFCRMCIEQMKKDNKPCPLCNESEFTYLRHYGSERNLKALGVFCSYKKHGCQWKGKLGDFEQHLNEVKLNII